MPKQNETTPIRVTTPECILSYPHLFEPTKVNQNNASEKAKYSASFVFAPGVDLTDLKAAAAEAGLRKWGGKFEGMVKEKKLRLPFRTDAVEKGYAEGSVFINARSDNKPGLVMPFAGEDGRPANVENPDIMYPGSRVRASLVAFAYDTLGNMGVSFALGNVQWLGDGERLDSRVAAADDFTVVDDAEAPGEVASSVADLL